MVLKAKALINSGSSESFIHQRVEEKAAFSVCPSSSTISMVSSSLAMKVSGHCFVDHSNLRLSDLCADLILGHNFQSQTENAVLKYGGSKPSLSVNTLNMDQPQLFTNLMEDYHPIVVKSC